MIDLPHYDLPEKDIEIYNLYGELNELNRYIIIFRKVIDDQQIIIDKLYKQLEKKK